MRWWAVERPLPIPNEETAPFWQGVEEGKLLLQTCGACGMQQYPPSPVCTRCLSLGPTWVPASGRGRVFSFAIYRKAFYPAFNDELPYVVADVELDEGPIMLSNVVGCAPENVYIGMPVHVVFDKLGAEAVLARFAPDT